MPAEPQQIACSAGSARVEAGDRVEQLARLDADPLRVGEMARVLEGDAQLERMPLGPRLLRQQLGDVDDAHVEPRVLQVRAAARGVDGDRVDTAANRSADGLRPPFPLLPPAGMEMERAAARLARRRDDLVALRRQHARRGGVHVAEDDALHAARQQTDTASSRHRSGQSPPAAARATARAERARRSGAQAARQRASRRASARAPRAAAADAGRRRRRASAGASRLPAARTAPRRPRASARSAGRSERRTGTRSRTPCSRGSGRCARRRRS